MNIKNKEKIKKYALVLMLALGLFVVLFPFVWMFSTAFKSTGTAFSFSLIPDKLDFSNFNKVIAGENLSTEPEYVPFYDDLDDKVHFVTESDGPVAINGNFTQGNILEMKLNNKNIREYAQSLENGEYKYSFHNVDVKKDLYTYEVTGEKKSVRFEAPFKANKIYIVGNLTGWRAWKMREKNDVHYNYKNLDPGLYKYYFTTEVPKQRTLSFTKNGRFLKLDELGIVPVIKGDNIEIYYEPQTDKDVYYVTDQDDWKISSENKAMAYGRKLYKVVLPLKEEIYINFFEIDDVNKIKDLDVKKGCYHYIINKGKIKIGKNDFWHEFKKVFFTKGNFARYFINSLIVAFFAALLTTFICSFSGYVFAKKEFYGKDVLFKFLLAGMMVPGMMFMVPQYVLVYKLGTIDFLNIGKILSSLQLMGMNTYGAMFIPHLANVFGLFMIKQYMETIPTSLIEAARIDGASESKIFYRVIVPISSPIIMTLFLLTFIGQWSNFLWQLIISTSSTMYTLPVGLAMFQGQYASEWTKLMAASTITVVPIIILFLIAQRYFIEGMTKGAVKG